MARTQSLFVGSKMVSRSCPVTFSRRRYFFASTSTRRVIVFAVIAVFAGCFPCRPGQAAREKPNLTSCQKAMEWLKMPDGDQSLFTTCSLSQAEKGPGKFSLRMFCNLSTSDWDYFPLLIAPFWSDFDRKNKLRQEENSTQMSKIWAFFFFLFFHYFEPCVVGAVYCYHDQPIHQGLSAKEPQPSITR